MTEYSKLVSRYKKFREITRELHSILTKQVTKKTLEECGRRLGIMVRGTFVFRDMDEGAVLMDYCIYEYRQDGTNVVSRYLVESPPVLDSDEYVVLKAMSESFYTLVQVERVLPGVGAEVDDLLGDRKFLIIDMGLGATAVKGLIIATRVLLFEDFTMTSGAPLVVEPKTLAEIFDFAEQKFGFKDEKYINFDMRQRMALTTEIIRLCLKQTDSHIEYQDEEGIETVSVPQPLRRESRVGRNDPCPCGSGRKYKRCCGR